MDRMFRLLGRFGILLPVLLCMVRPTHGQAQGKTYLVSCGGTVAPSAETAGIALSSLSKVNQIMFQGGDSLLFARGTVCEGTLSPHGSGSAGSPILIASYGRGPLPRIHAAEGADTVFQLHNQQRWTITELDLEGGKRSGLSITASEGTMHDIVIRDVRVHDVRGEIHGKEDGLVTIHPTGPNANFYNVLIDNVQAFNTSQWSGIFVSGGSLERRTTRVQIQNSIVHDVQGDGIVLFVVQDGTIRNSTAWHTGMQHSYTIGTPNAIWTWRCDRCTVEQNEAFLTDSPGVDGGSFDIDFGNSKNRVLHNFGHHTQGYCVSVFGAFEETSDSEIAENTCLSNGLSPRLAQRQGAILFMTWSGGTIRRVNVHDNTISWDPAGSVAAIQTGSGLDMTGLVFTHNRIFSMSPVFLAPELRAYGTGNEFYFAGEPSKYVNNLKAGRLADPSLQSCSSASGALGNCISGFPVLRRTTGKTEPVVLTLNLNEDDEGLNTSRAWLAILSSVTAQFSGKPVEYRVAVCPGAQRTRQLVQDLLIMPQVVLVPSCNKGQPTEFKLSSWDRHREVFTDRATLWLKLRDYLGEPLYGNLPMLEVFAHD